MRTAASGHLVDFTPPDLDALGVEWPELTATRAELDKLADRREAREGEAAAAQALDEARSRHPGRPYGTRRPQRCWVPQRPTWD